MLKADCYWKGRHRPMHSECSEPRNRELYLKGQCLLWEHSRLAMEVNMALDHGFRKATELFCNMVFINIVNILCLLFLRINSYL